MAIVAMAAILLSVVAPSPSGAARTDTDYDDVTSSNRTAQIRMTGSSSGCASLSVDIEIRLKNVTSQGADIDAIRVRNRTTSAITFWSLQGRSGGFNGSGPEIAANSWSAWMSTHPVWNYQLFNKRIQWYSNGVSDAMIFGFYTRQSGSSELNTACPMGNLARIYTGPGLKSGTITHQVERLYRAYFGRGSDQGGRNFWVERIFDGESMPSVSEHFARSGEFRRMYGSLSNTAFVNLVYRNVLGRNADAGGRNYWVGRLNRGLSRGGMMAHFSESYEFKQRTRLY